MLALVELPGEEVQFDTRALPDNFCHASATVVTVCTGVQTRTARHTARKSN
jgi:hypothetical protein